MAERRSRKEVVEALLRRPNLWEVRKQNLSGYSGAMRQRFGVAVALLGNPKLLTGRWLLSPAAVPHPTPPKQSGNG